MTSFHESGGATRDPATPTVIPVRAAAPYDVVVGSGILDRLTGLFPGAERIAVIHAAELGEVTAGVVEALPEAEVLQIPLPDGEAAKTTEVAERCWEALGAAGFTRSDAVVGVGGGATTDLAGFVAATWLRGVRVAHVPTTVLGMVDAAVGGKTGINTRAGKNLVGAFHEPVGVVCDLHALGTLPRREVTAGLAEAVKCGFIADPAILELVEAKTGDAHDPRSSTLRELVERAVRVKAEVVSGDLRETGGSDATGRAATHPGREALNYGHTLAHAIERSEGYTVRHGDAVAIGMCFVAELARRSGLLDETTARRHREALIGLGLPTTYADLDRAPASFETVLSAMRVDKKARGSLLRFVVLHGLADPRVLSGPDEGLLRACYREVTG